MIQGIVGWRNLSITQIWLAKRCGDGVLRGEGVVRFFCPYPVKEKRGLGYREGKSDTSPAIADK